MRISKSVMVDFIFNTLKFDRDIYGKDMSIQEYEIPFGDKQVFYCGCTIKIKAGAELYIFNFSELNCELKIIDENNKLIARHDLSNIWSIYHVRHAIRLDPLIDYVQANIVELEKMYKLSNDEIEGIKIDLEWNKMKDLLDILNDRKYNQSKNLIEKLTKKFLKPKQAQIDTKTQSDSDASVSGKVSEENKKPKLEWDPKDFGM